MLGNLFLEKLVLIWVLKKKIKINYNQKQLDNKMKAEKKTKIIKKYNQCVKSYVYQTIFIYKKGNEIVFKKKYTFTMFISRHITLYIFTCCSMYIKSCENMQNKEWSIFWGLKK